MTDVFLICFSVVNPASFQNVREEWVPELQEYAPSVPYLLIGTQVSPYTTVHTKYCHAQLQIAVSVLINFHTRIVLSIAFCHLQYVEMNIHIPHILQKQTHCWLERVSTFFRFQL